MAKIQAQVTGGAIKQIEASTIKDAKAQLGVPNYSAQVNGDPQSDDYELSDYEFLSLTESVKGGQ